MITAALLGSGVAAGATVLAVGGGRDTTTASAGSGEAARGGNQATGGTARDVSTTSPSALNATQIYKGASSGVVQIRAVTAQGEDLGTGIVLDKTGLILTNDHVVAGAQRLTVSPGAHTDATRPAVLVGEEANDDLALIKVDPSGLGLKPLKLVSSNATRVGDTVYAIGNPYGLDETLTRGIVSALGRQIKAPDGAQIAGAIQTDAALNPGNSGGPLLNQEGDVIGVNSQIASDQASVGGSQPGSTGVGFAISSNTATEAIKRIEAGRGVSSESQTGSSQGEAGAEEVPGTSAPGQAGGASEGSLGGQAEGLQAEEAAGSGAEGGSAGPVIIVP
jgi:putative serine protease PepD